MYSLPAGWHGINVKSPSRKSKSSSHPHPAANPPRAKQQSAPLPLIERRKWNYSVGLDPSKIRSSNYTPKRTMPVTKTRARSMANGQEARVRTQEEVSVEIQALRKEVAHAKDENTMLKGRLRRMEEDSAKKVKHYEKLLVTAKRESLASDRRKESDAVTMLKQKCARLEQTAKEKEALLKKVQQEKTLLKTREVKSVPDFKDSSNLRTSLDNRRIPPKTAPRANSVQTTAEMSRLKDSTRKLQQENSSLLQQLKERDQEIKQLKMQLVKAQRPPPTTRRSIKVPEVRPNNRTQERPINKPKVVHEQKIEKKVLENGDCHPCEERIHQLQKNIAAKRIQRGWREHRVRIEHHSHQANKMTHGITDEQEGQATVLLQSVMRGHRDRMEYVNQIQQKLGDEVVLMPQEE